MNLVWHIVKKDLRYLRLYLLFWVGLVGYQVFISHQLLTGASVDLNWFIEMGLQLNLVMVVALLVSFILVAMLVLEDPLVGSDMFWVTRPISGRTLLGAKLVSAVVIFGIVPVLLWLPWWMSCGYSAGDLLDAAGRTGCFQLLGVVPAFVLASLVGRTGRFMVVSVILLVAILVTLLKFFASGPQATSIELVRSRMLLAGVIFAVFGAAAVWSQYSRRRLTPAMSILIVGIVLSVGAATSSPWILGEGSSGQNAESDRIAGEIGAARDARRSDPANPSGIGLDIQVKLDGVPETEVVNGGRADIELKWSDGTSIVRQGLPLRADFDPVPLRLALGLPARDSWQFSGDPETESRIAAHASEAKQDRFRPSGGLHVGPDEKRHVAFWVTLGLSNEEMTKLRASPAACSIRARLKVQRPETAVTVPMVSNASAVGTGARLNLLNLAPFEVHAKNGDRGTWLMGVTVAATAPGMESLELCTLDRTRGEGWTYGRTYSFSALPISSRIEALYFSVSSPHLWRTDHWTDLPAGSGKSELVGLAFRDRGWIARDFSTPRLIVAAENP